MIPGTLWKIIIDNLFFAQKSDDSVHPVKKGNIITFLESKKTYDGENYYFLYGNKIIYRQIYRLDEWMTEIKT